jgi:integrase
MMRSEVQDIDLAGRWLTIREKKKQRGQHTTRRVPISSTLAEVLGDWLKTREGQKYLFSGRKGMLTVQAVQKAFVCVLRGGKWSVIRGWHTMRHSVISAMASAGVDQRIIQDIVGHLTTSMQRRYAHIYPTTKEDAIRKVFG